MCDNRLARMHVQRSAFVFHPERSANDHCNFFEFGALPRFHNTHSLNTQAHYFYFRPSRPPPRSSFMRAKTDRG